MHHEFYYLAKNIVNAKDNKLALATVLHVSGSAYRREGTRMIIGKTGEWSGNISGGCLEGDIVKRSQSVIESGKSQLLTYDTRESKNKEIRVALGCNGVIDILVEPVSPEIIQLSKSVVDLFEKEETAFLSTQIEWKDNSISIARKLEKSIPEDFPVSAFENENHCGVKKEDSSIKLFEFIGLQRKLVIWGSGPDVRPLAKFADQLGWATVVASDCGIENLQRDLKNTKIIQCNFDDFIQKANPHSNTAVLLVSHDFYKDHFILEKTIPSKVKYIGIMGPKRRGDRMIKELEQRKPGIEIDKSRLFYPIGLDIGSDNPVEIALSIVAEIQSVFSNKNAAPLKEKNSRIHDSITEENMDEYNPNDQICSINSF